MHVHVYGAGVMGLCIATELAAREHEVEVFDRADRLGPACCSWWAGGMLAPYCEAESAEPAVTRHGESAVRWWEDQTACVRRTGTLVLAMRRDRSELKRFSRVTRNHRTLDHDQVSELEPALEGRFEQALYFRDEAHLDPRKALNVLLARLQDKGVRMHYGVDGRSVACPAGARINATGLAARSELDELRGVKGEMIILRCPEVRLKRTIRLLHPRIPIYLVPRTDHTYMLGATMIENDERTRISARSMLELLGALYALHPAFAEAEIVEIGVDARPAFDDNLPRLCRKNDVFYANGLYRHGFLLAPAVARMIAEKLKHPQSKPEFWYGN